MRIERVLALPYPRDQALLGGCADVRYHDDDRQRGARLAKVQTARPPAGPVPAPAKPFHDSPSSWDRRCSDTPALRNLVTGLAGLTQARRILSAQRLRLKPSHEQDCTAIKRGQQQLVVWRSAKWKGSGRSGRRCEVKDTAMKVTRIGIFFFPPRKRKDSMNAGGCMRFPYQ